MALHTLGLSNRPSRMLGSGPSQLGVCQGELRQLRPQERHTFYRDLFSIFRVISRQVGVGGRLQRIVGVPIVSSTSAGRWVVAEKALAAWVAGRLLLRQAERARVCRSIVSSRRAQE